MRYKLLGKSGLRVSELCLGTMTFGEDWGWGSSKDESRQVYDAFLEAGGNFIDTANVYTNGTSERLLGEFTQGHRERVVLATKYTNVFLAEATLKGDQLPPHGAAGPGHFALSIEDEAVDAWRTFVQSHGVEVEWPRGGKSERH